MADKSKDPNLMSICVQILDMNGRKLVASKNAPRIYELSEHDLDHVLE